MLTRRDQCILGMYFVLVKKQYDANDNPIYEGYHFNHAAADTDTGWTIIKRTWAAGAATQVETQTETLTGAWQDRASLDWL